MDLVAGFALPLAEISKTSNAAVASLGVPYTWINSCVAGDKVYCVHEADDADEAEIILDTPVVAGSRRTR